jgi:hypothetical protein
MTVVLASLAPIAIAGALAPLPIALVITLLMSQRGLPKASAFVVAETLVYAGICVLAFSTSNLTVGSAGQRSAVIGTLFAVFGMALWWMALSQYVEGRRPERGGRGYFDKLDHMSAGSAALLGGIVTLLNVKQMGIYLVGVSTIVGAGASPTDTWTVSLLFLAVFQIGQIVAIAGYAGSRRRASGLLEGFRGWLLPRLRGMSVLLGSAVGAWFLVLAVEQLWA